MNERERAELRNYVARKRRGLIKTCKICGADLDDPGTALTCPPPAPCRALNDRAIRERHAATRRANRVKKAEEDTEQEAQAPERDGADALRSDDGSGSRAVHPVSEAHSMGLW